MINRSEVSRALAKAIAFSECGKQGEAEKWARKLVKLLECEGILTSKRESYLAEVGQNLLDCV